VERIERTLNSAGKPVNGSRILLLGVSYKAGVGDTRESPALKIVRRLRDLGGDVAYHDPHVPELSELGLRSVDLAAELGDADIAVIVTAHPEIDYPALVGEAALVLDFRGVTRGISAENLVRM
jgi:UDP-N-acetyl-D-glucosamine dehydrogenase